MTAVAVQTVPSLTLDQQLLLIDDDPHTVAGPGATCLSCGDDLDTGSVYVYATFGVEHGIVGGCCLAW